MSFTYTDNIICSADPGFVLPWWITDFWKEMDDFPEEFETEIWQLRELVTKAFKKEELIVDIGLAEQYFGLEKYQPFKLMPFQRAALGLWLCVFQKEDNMPRWPDVYILAARGTGKDGFIQFAAECLTSPYNTCEEYDVDICAMNEEQAMRPVEDFRKVLENPKFTAKLKKYWYWTKEVIKGRHNGGAIKGRTNNPKGRDGMRSGCIVFNEKHAYTDYKNIEVFETGLGKKEHPRTLVTTTDGNVVDGPLDADKKLIDKVLKGESPDDGLLPFVFRVHKDEDISNPKKWRCANPRLKRSPSLEREYMKEFKPWKENPDKHTSFPTKRLNLRKVDREIAVTTWENLLATNKPLEIPEHAPCVVGIDFSKSSDWVGVNAHFRKGDMRYDICHAFVCKQGAHFQKLRCPVEDWEKAGLLTIVDEPDIRPKIVKDYLIELGMKYNIFGVAIDSFRFTILSEALADIGYTYKEKNLKLIRKSDIIRVSPIVDSCFNRHLFSWGDNPMLRWATNNASLVKATNSSLVKNPGDEVDSGNYLYNKIEPIKRKTDPFMALVASMTIEDMLPEIRTSSGRRFGAVTF